MPDYDNTNRGVLFTNDRKEEDRHPDMKGKININGVDHWLSGWWKQSTKGDLLSLSLGAECESTKPREPERQEPTRDTRGRPQGRAPF